jgi:septal ring factor EnvC (AmiA/AmiB activator)
MHPNSILVCTSGADWSNATDVLSLCAAACAVQAQCQKDLKVLSKQIESKQADLEKAQLELQHQQKTEAAVEKRIGEAERRIQVCKDMGLVKEDYREHTRVSKFVTCVA